MAANNSDPGMSRDQIIIRTSILGIASNILLVVFKAIVGVLSNSIAIVLDAVNNLSDALSSVITIIGTRLAKKQPDKDHPYGHGRAEYLSATTIALIVLYAGITSLVESVKKIIHPEAPDYSAVTLVVVAAAVAVKIFLGLYFKKRGKEVDSDSLVNSGQDALLDAVISISTLAAAVIFMTTKASLEAYLGVIISIVIIRSGIEMLREAISRIIGERADSELARQVKQTVCSVQGVQGAYDLIMHDYGPDRTMASVHIEVPDTFTADQIDRMTREIQQKVYMEDHVILTAVGIYSHNTSNDKIIALQEEIRRIAMSQEYVLQMHGFYLDPVKKTLRFDAVVDFAAPNRTEVYKNLCDKVQELVPDYKLSIILDSDISD